MFGSDLFLESLDRPAAGIARSGLILDV